MGNKLEEIINKRMSEGWYWSNPTEYKGNYYFHLLPNDDRINWCAEWKLFKIDGNKEYSYPHWIWSEYNFDNNKLKCFRVIGSCETKDQLDVAKEYCQKFINFYDIKCYRTLATINKSLNNKFYELENNK